MHHGEVDSQKNSSVSFYIELIQAMEQMSSSIDNFSNATLLKGTAYDSAKSYFSQTHKNLAQGFVYLAEEMIRQVEEFPSGFKSSVSGSDVIEDQLNDQLNRLRSLADGAEALSKALPLMNPLVSLYEAMEKSIQEKITKLHDYNQTSSSSFETAIQMIDNLTNGLADIGSDKGWDSSSGSFNLTGLKMDWVQPIKDIESKKREKEQKEPDTTGRKYIFLEIAPGVRMWVWSSDGRTANQSDLIFTERHNAWKVKYAIKQEMEREPSIEELIMENYTYHFKRFKTGKDENGRELTTLEKIQSGSVILSGIASLASIGYWGNKVGASSTPKTPKGKTLPKTKHPVTKKASGAKLNKLTPNEINNMSLDELRNSIPDDWQIFENNGRVHIKDANGNFRVKIDPPDKVTQYKHMHIYDSDYNPLDINGNIVGRKSSDAHIPWADK